MRRIWTIGHSSRALGELLALLEEHALAGVADVRRFPVSRRYPHFTREPLAEALGERGIAYRHFPGLGGRRRGLAGSPHRGWEVAGFRHYADHMETGEFREALRELERWAEGEAVAVLCAEVSPFSCHRRLIADALLRDGFTVTHVLGPSRARDHALTPFARLEGERIVYDGGVLPLE